MFIKQDPGSPFRACPVREGAACRTPATRGTSLVTPVHFQAAPRRLLTRRPQPGPSSRPDRGGGRPGPAPAPRSLPTHTPPQLRRPVGLGRSGKRGCLPAESPRQLRLSQRQPSGTARRAAGELPPRLRETGAAARDGGGGLRRGPALSSAHPALPSARRGTAGAAKARSPRPQRNRRVLAPPRPKFGEALGRGGVGGRQVGPRVESEARRALRYLLSPWRT